MTATVEGAPSAAAARYRRAKAIAMAALEHPFLPTVATLAAACGDDAELLREVRWLLDAASDASLDDTAALPPCDPLASGDARMEAPLPRDYRVLRRIGEGGMGVVYLAERIDAGLHQRVALKLLHPLPDTDPATRRRFANERRILSTLSHPNIARLLDGGVTAVGLPFLAMEHVDGERIDHYCDRHALGVRDRVALFLKVCAAVEHAHRQLVIHRDIKPSNILVGPDGEPKLLDFGIARLLDAQTTDATRTDLHALTLAYASPEQIEGGTLGTATDVYSLGVVLYLLLAGSRPYEALESGHLLPQAIIAGDVPPPSRLARSAARAADGPRRVATLRIPADLDAIVLKAMRCEPDQRYASAGAFAADLRRFLCDRPVRARRSHWHYRLRRLAWRRRGVLSVAAVFALTLGVSASEWLRQQQRISIERDHAAAVVRYMDSLYQNTNALHVRGQDVTVREMLDGGVSGLRARDDLPPEHRIALLVATGRAYNALGLSGDAVTLLEEARSLLDTHDADDTQRANLALALGAAYSGTRRLGDAIAADEEALDALDGDPARADDIAMARIRRLHNHAVMLDLPLAEIRTRLDAVLAELDARKDAPPSLKIAAWRAMVMAHGSDADGALAAAAHAMRIAEANYAPDDPRLLPVRYAWVTAVQARDPARAAELLPDLIDDHERRTGPSVRVAELLSNHGATLTRLGRAEESLPVFGRATAMAREVSGEDSQLYRLTLANHAAAHIALGEGERAAALVRQVLPGLIAEARATGATEAQVFLAAARETLAAAALLRHDAAGAERELMQAADGLDRVDPDAYPELYARVLARLADVQRDLQHDAALRHTLERLDRLRDGRADPPLPGDHAKVRTMR